MPTTRFTEPVGCAVLIQRAPFGGCVTPWLAAAVAAPEGSGWSR